MLQMDNAALEEKLAALQAARRLAEQSGEAQSRNGAFGAQSQPEPVNTAKPDPKPRTAEVQPEPEPAATTPAPTPEPKPAATPAQAAAGPWFVNFAAYSREADARTRADSLQVSAGAVRVLSVDVDGRTLYRVRITGLPDRERAESLARELEKNYGVGRLWVGKN